MLDYQQNRGVTLGIYAIHQSVMAIILRLMSQYVSEELGYSILVIALWFVVVAISYVVYCLLDKNRYTALLFLGKNS